MIVILTCVASALGAKAARAEDDHSQSLADAVHVQSGQHCVEAQSLAGQIGAWLGGTRIDAGLRIDVAEGDATTATLGFALQRAGEVIAERQFDPAPPGCVQREATLSLAVALALKATLLEELGLAAPAAPPEAPAPPAPAPPVPPPPHRPWAAPSAPASWSLGMFGSESFSVLPEGAWGLGAALARRTEAGLSLALSAASRAASHIRGSDTAAGSFDARLHTLGLDACASTPLFGTTKVGACLGLLAGLLSLRGHGFETSYNRLRVWSAGTCSVALHTQITERLAVDATTSLVVPLTHVQIEVKNSTDMRVESHRLAGFGAELRLGPAYTFR